MEKKCCICGKTFVGYGNNAEPIRKGICCNICNTKYVFGSRFLNPRRNTSYEIVKTEEEKKEISNKLKEKNFEIEKIIPLNVLFHNPETEEDVVICIL